MKKSNIFLGIIILTIGIAILLLLTTNKENNIGTKLKEIIEKNNEQPSEKNTIEEINKEENLAETTNFNIENNKGGSSESRTDSLNSECTIKKITYSMTDLNKTSICNEYDREICIDKTVDCKIKITNREEELTGFFQIELKTIEEND